MKIALQLFINSKYFILSKHFFLADMHVSNRPVFLRNYFTSIKTDEQIIEICIWILEPVQTTTSQGFSLSKAYFSPFTHWYNMFYNQLKYLKIIIKKNLLNTAHTTLFLTPNWDKRNSGAKSGPGWQSSQGREFIHLSPGHCLLQWSESPHCPPRPQTDEPDLGHLAQSAAVLPLPPPLRSHTLQCCWNSCLLCWTLGLVLRSCHN